MKSKARPIVCSYHTFSYVLSSRFRYFAFSLIKHNTSGMSFWRIKNSLNCRDYGYDFYGYDLHIQNTLKYIPIISIWVRQSYNSIQILTHNHSQVYRRYSNVLVAVFSNVIHVFFVPNGKRTHNTSPSTQSDGKAFRIKIKIFWSRKQHLRAENMYNLNEFTADKGRSGKNGSPTVAKSLHDRTQRWHFRDGGWQSVPQPDHSNCNCSLYSGELKSGLTEL